MGLRYDESKNTICIDNEKIISHIESYKKYIEKSKEDELIAEKFPEFSEINIYKLDLDNVTPCIKSDKFHFLDYSIEKYRELTKCKRNVILGNLENLNDLWNLSHDENDFVIKNGIAIVWAKYIVRYGYKKLYERLNKLKIFVPYAKFHDIISFDKIEIEQLRDIERSMMDYNRNTDLQSPLSIAVFGEPGSGKSYTIEEIAEDIFKTKKHTVLTFNISQLKDSDELIESFRLIQNAVLKDIIPIVFWDEFDSMYGQEELGWLKYFLAPMQSGKFLYNQVEYKIGRCIFIFAGGTCATHKEFVSKCKDTGMKKVKAPDFLGRLKATLDIPSLSRPKDRIINDVEEKLYKDSLDLYGTFIKNHLNDLIKKDSSKISPEELVKKYAQYELLRYKKADKDIYEKLIAETDYQLIKANLTEKTYSILEKAISNKYSDFSYIFKRAMVLRQNLLKILNKNQDDELEMEDPVLNAFLMVDKYYYDSRSMIAILNLFHIQYKEFGIRTSGIPSAQQLSLHTNEKDFIKYCKCNYDNELIFIKGSDSDILAETIIKIMRWYQEILKIC